MYKEKQRTVAIVNELITFLLNNKVSSMYINVKNNEKETRICLYCSISDMKILEQLQMKIMSNRCEEIEELYWELLGDSSGREELYLLGKMIDESKIHNIDANRVKIILVRSKTQVEKN